MGTTSEVAVPGLWADVDTGKAEHHCVVIDVGGKRVLSRRVANDENAPRKLLSDVVELSEAGPVTWAIDLNSGGAALMIALLTDNGQKALYVPGRTVHHASGSYRGDGKTWFRDHPHAEAILSMPGIGPGLGAEFIAYSSGDMSVFGSPDRLAGVAGLVPVPKDSGRISGNMRRPRRYCRRLLRVFYISAVVAARCCPVSKAFYERKRADGKSHKQAIMALARRRLKVIWALIRRPYLRNRRAPAPLSLRAETLAACHQPGHDNRIGKRLVTLDHGLQAFAVAHVAGRDADEEGQSVRVRQEVHLGTGLAAVHGARTCVFAPFWPSRGRCRGRRG
jgi:hypothetical protein